MSRCAALWLAFLLVAASATALQPRYAYQPQTLLADSRLVQNAPTARLIEHEGRPALHLPGIRSRFILPAHTVNAPRGTLTMWVLPLDDLFPSAHYDQHKQSNPFFENYVFLSDKEAVGDVAPALFCFYYRQNWHPGIIAKFSGGDIFTENIWTLKPGAVATSGHFEQHRLRWYQLAVTWDRSASEYCIYANGVLVGHSDAWAGQPLRNERCGPMLYGGNPALGYSTIEFYDDVLAPETLKAKYAAERPREDPELMRQLEHMYEGRGLPPFAFAPDGTWRKGLSVPFDRADDLLDFYLQGAVSDLRFEEGGLRVVTPPLEKWLQRAPGSLDRTRMYLWSRRTFEGDLYVRVEFKLQQHGGLALLMTQAAGMQGESFLDDYPLRSDGSMHMVCWEDVRNYHWEFYREISDVRNDLVSHACLKNPWYRPMSFQIENRRWETGRWYVLEYLQEGARLRGAIDGVTVMDVTDTGFDNNGPVLLNGRIALRCMMRTDIVFRNLRVLDRPLVRTVSPLP